jgi:hypothetical protein
MGAPMGEMKYVGGGGDLSRPLGKRTVVVEERIILKQMLQK